MSRPKILFALLGSPGVASSRVRGYWVIEELNKLGIETTVTEGSSKLSLLKSLALLPSHNCLVLQKRYSRWDYYLLKTASLLGMNTVIDIDDKYSKTDNPKTLKNFTRVLQTASAATLGSKELLDFALQYQSNSHLLPTSVKLANYRPLVRAAERDRVTLGWIGNGRHYHLDLIKTLKNPLANVARDYNITLKLVGVCGQKDLHEEFASIPGLETQFIDSLDWSDESQVFQAMSDFDIGLYPLSDSDFNKFKCGFKALEYMAMAIPVIASPVGSNCYIIDDGVNGFLADREQTWTSAISALVQDQAKRQSMGAAGRKKVESSFNVKEQARLLLKVLDEANAST